MSIFAIGDLHLPGETYKPMDVFGDHWRDHWGKIRADWNATVTADDLVLLPGDISWAMKLEEAAPALAEVCEMPGTKLMLRGNHDYWWGSLARVRGMLENETYVLQNDCFLWRGYAVIGTRGWTVGAESGDDKKIYDREVQRLTLSITALGKAGAERVIGMMHYPPFDEKQRPSDFTCLFEEAGATDVVYGHLHGAGLKYCNEVEEIFGVRYHLVSCDFLDFKLKQIL